MDIKSTFLIKGSITQCEDDWRGVLTEAHGMLFDILVLGILLAIYEAFRSKKDKIERYFEELEDYRRWKGKEASYRIQGLVKRLNKEGVSNKINLTDCFLNDAKIRGANLAGAQMVELKAKRADFSVGKFQSANLQLSNLSDAILVGSNFQFAIMEDANLSMATLLGSDFQFANLKNADLRGVKICSMGANSEQIEEDLFQSMKKSDPIVQEYVLSHFKNAKFGHARLRGAKAYESQKGELAICGADLSQMIFLKDPI